MKWYVGIDVGQSGGISAIKDDEVRVIPMPVHDVGYDLNSIVEFLLDLGQVAMVTIEKVHTNPKMSNTGSFTFGKGLGMLEGVVAALRLPYQLVPPQTWQKVMLQGTVGDTKARSIKACSRLFPYVDLKPTARSKKDHDGMSDALLICEYGRRKVNG